MKKNQIAFLFVLLLTAGTAYASSSSGDGTGAPEASMTHRMMMMALQLGGILFAAKLGGMLFERLKMPSVLGELAAGALIGPFALGAIALPGMPDGFFPVFAADFPISPELYGVCTLASIILLFETGLETDLRLFMKYAVAGGAVGIGGVVFSFAFGAVATMFFSEMVFGRPLGFFAPECLMLGVISTATSVGITARLLSEKRKMEAPEGVTIIAGAVIDDVLGIITLAVVLGVIAARGHGSDHTVEWSRIGIIAAKAVGIWLAATITGILASRRIGFVLKLFKNPSSIAIMALGFALILSGFFEEAGLAMIVGAYVAGLSLSSTDISHLIRERLKPLYHFLVPVFFCVMGMLVDFQAMASAKVLIFGAVYSVLAIAAKVIGCGFPALFFGFNFRGAARIGCGMTPRGEVALVVAGIGLSVGALTPDVFGVAILMTLVTTLVAPPVLSKLMDNPEPGTRKPLTKDKDLIIITHTFTNNDVAQFVLSDLLESFRSEGFYVHLLDADMEIYAIRKDDTSFSVRRDREEISFDCHVLDKDFINMALYVVLGHLERTIQAMRAPIDKQSIIDNVTASVGQRHQTGIVRDVRLKSYIKPSNLLPAMTSATVPDAISELLDVIVKAGELKDKARAMDALLAHESTATTGIGNRVAIPHARTDAVDHLVCAIGVHQSGIDFGSPDGEPARVIVLTLSPEKGTAPHLQFLSAISQALSPNAKNALMDSRTPEDMYLALIGDPYVERPNGK
ncbi:MAG: cation:proton antiporter [Planctomycetota bacterium]